MIVVANQSQYGESMAALLIASPDSNRAVDDFTATNWQGISYISRQI
jgi:hypothetical protein